MGDGGIATFPAFLSYFLSPFLSSHVLSSLQSKCRHERVQKVFLMSIAITEEQEASVVLLSLLTTLSDMPATPVLICSTEAEAEDYSKVSEEVGYAQERMMTIKLSSLEPSQCPTHQRNSRLEQVH
jgi:hypothetical protein